LRLVLQCVAPSFVLRQNKEDTIDEHYRKEIGEIDGITVYGQYYGDDGTPSVVFMQWKDWQIETNGMELRFPTRGDEVGHMRVTDYWRIKEMTQAGVVDGLIERKAIPRLSTRVH
jgi:hypothetical protein